MAREHHPMFFRFEEECGRGVGSVRAGLGKAANLVPVTLLSFLYCYSYKLVILFLTSFRVCVCGGAFYLLGGWGREWKGGLFSPTQPAAPFRKPLT